MLRAIGKEPQALERMLAEIRLAGDERLTRSTARIRMDTTEADVQPGGAGGRLLCIAPQGDAGRAFGTLARALHIYGVIPAHE